MMEVAEQVTTQPGRVMLRQFTEIFRPFLDNPEYTGFAVNRPGEIWARSRSTWDYFPLPELTFEHCARFTQLVASANGGDISSGFVSGTLAGGERINIAVPPACQPGTYSFTVRKFTDQEMTVEELENQGAFSLAKKSDRGLTEVENKLLALRDNKRFAEFLRLAVQSKMTILICGGTGSGKTYLMKSLVRCIPPTERLITLEDAWEVRLMHHKNKVHLFYTRGEGKAGAISPKDGLAACLRMEPSRILLAELRGDEAWEFIKAVGTGHPGCISTIHANSATEAFDQALALIKDSKTGAHLDSEFIKRRLYATIDIVLHYADRTLQEVYYDPEHKRKNMV